MPTDSSTVTTATDMAATGSSSMLVPGRCTRDRMNGTLSGPPSMFTRFGDMPRATAAPPTEYSRMRAQPMSQATLHGVVYGVHTKQFTVENHDAHLKPLLLLGKMGNASEENAWGDSHAQ